MVKPRLGESNTMRRQIAIELIIPTSKGNKKYPCNLPTGSTLLDAVNYVQEKIDPSVSIRWNCRSGQCGLCAITVNGRPSLACREKVVMGATYNIGPPLLGAPLDGLITDVTDIYLDYFGNSGSLGISESELKGIFENLLLRK